MAHFCPGCGHKLEDYMQFCTECGTKAPGAKAPVVEEAPAVEKVPAVEEAPVVEEAPAVEEAPVVEEVPVVEETPVVEVPAQVVEIPAQTIEVPAQTVEIPEQHIEVPTVEETPVAEEAPVVETAPVAEPVQPAYPIAQPVPAHIPTPVQPVAEPAPAPATVIVPAEVPAKNGIVSTGTFFGLMFLYQIPVIGWLTCLILCFAPKKHSLRHYSRAVLIWALIGLFFSAAIVGVAYALGGVILENLGVDLDSVIAQGKDFWNSISK